MNNIKFIPINTQPRILKVQIQYKIAHIFIALHVCLIQTIIGETQDYGTKLLHLYSLYMVWSLKVDSKNSVILTLQQCTYFATG
jgi:hypothetical protein